MTKKERTFLAEGLKKLCADIAAIACAIEGDEVPEAKPEPTAEKARAPEKTRTGKAEAVKKAEESTPPSAEAAAAEKRAEGQVLPTEKDTESAPPVPEKTYTFEEVRGILAEKSRSGFRAEVKGLLAKRHVNQLSEITDPEELARLVREAEGIGIE